MFSILCRRVPVRKNSIFCLLFNNFLLSLQWFLSPVTYSWYPPVSDNNNYTRRRISILQGLRLTHQHHRWSWGRSQSIICLSLSLVLKFRTCFLRIRYSNFVRRSPQCLSKHEFSRRKLSQVLLSNPGQWHCVKCFKLLRILFLLKI